MSGTLALSTPPGVQSARVPPLVDSARQLNDARGKSARNAAAISHGAHVGEIEDTIHPYAPARARLSNNAALPAGAAHATDMPMSAEASTIALHFPPTTAVGV